MRNRARSRLAFRVFHSSFCIHHSSFPMKLSDLTTGAGEWLRGSGPMSEIVISSRIRLARNVAGYNFLSRCTKHQRQLLEAKVRQTILDSRVAPQTLYV